MLAAIYCDGYYLIQSCRRLRSNSGTTGRRLVEAQSGLSATSRISAATGSHIGAVRASDAGRMTLISAAFNELMMLRSLRNLLPAATRQQRRFCPAFERRQQIR